MVLSILLEQVIMANINRDPHRRYSYDSEDTRESIAALLNSYNITPLSHKSVGDFAAGDGSISAILKEIGWPEIDMVCIDKFQSPTPLLNQVRWVYQDLFQVVHAISSGKEPDNEISQYRRSFDIVAIYQSPFRAWEEEVLVKYFASNANAFVLTSWHIGYVSRK